jgi:hypothetical protein
MKIKMLKVLIVLMSLGMASQAQNWEPYNFKGDEMYTFKIIYDEDGDGKTAIYSIDIKSTGEKNATGEHMHEVTYTTSAVIPENELGEQTAFGFWSAYGMSLSFVFLNPMYTMMFTQMEFEVGEKMSFFGAGKAEITGKERVGNREGYVCKYIQNDGDEGEQLVGEWVIDPELAFPLKSVTYDGEEVQSHIELVEYKKY